MTRAEQARRPLVVRDLVGDDLDDVVRIDALHTGERKPAYWRRKLRGFLDDDDERTHVRLAAREDPAGPVIGYLLGEVRAFEFGSEPCGWIFAVGVEPRALRERVASLLLAECCRRFRQAGVARVRTMVERTNVPVLSFFRANGFVAGRFVQLELDIEEQA
jgi:ribosomal protein S18 acetylase RimI-like enzyme